ncbi:MAG: hypothetical protein MUF06_10690 [Pirellulaceae bacterium]|jgi:hypothetical protein|nr:hypothetical protein [Pirellulaceae bacterium]
MKYTVVNSSIADLQLAELWLQASDRQQVADAFDRMESELKRDPNSVGRMHPSGWSVVAVPPIVAALKVSEDDRLVKVLSIDRR